MLPHLVVTQPLDYPWQQAIALHGRRVVVALLARGVLLHEAEELAQETWARLIAQRSQGRLTHVDLPGLAVRQALFLLSDARRKRAREAAEPFDDEQRPAALDLERSLATKQQLALARRCLEGLSPRAKEIFDFVYVHPELNHEQAATQLGLSTQRLRQTLCEVRGRLRDAMKELP